MRCAKCSKDNQAGSKFCAECGAGLSSACPRCAAETSPAAKFCRQCGAVLQAQAAKPEPSLREQVSAGERRHLTILFCDLVGSTTLAARVDAEEWRATLAGYQQAAAQAITRFG